MFASGTAAAGGGHLTVNRGDVSSHDFSGADFTQDGAYHDLDLSSILPVGAVAVQVVVNVLSAVLGLGFSLKEKDYTSVTTGRFLVNRVISSVYNEDHWLGVGSTRIIEYKAASGLWLNLTLSVVAWKIPA